MAPSRAAASYKKQNGIVAISKDRRSLSWSPAQPPDASPSLVVSVANVENLQQTPETAAKVMLKVYDKPPGQTETVAHTFTFTSSTDARMECNAIKEVLAKAIQDYKAEQAARLGTSGGGQSAAMTIANAISGRGSWEDDEKLNSDVRLQQSLMAEDPSLQKTFLEARNLKPEAISMTQFTAQFWSSRLHLLRAHALAKNQGRGRSNVFSELKKDDGGRAMTITPEHIRAIFDQYPVMKQIYDELVPKKMNDEVSFWSHFFQSKLYMALRGMKIDRNSEADPLLDPYLDLPEITGLRPKVTESSYMPKFIDLEGNEENNPQRKGNLERVEADPRFLGRAPVIQKLNALSEKLMASVRPSDVDVSAPIGLDEAEYEELRLRDLAGDPEQNKIILNIRDQSRFFTEREQTKSDKLNPFRKQDPARAVKSVCSDITSHFPRPGHGPIPVAPIDDDQDYDDEDGPESGSTAATEHILSLIKAHKDQVAEIPAGSGLPAAIYERLTLTHATTIEFLRQFWNAFLSGDDKRVNEVASLVDSLSRALERINTIADDAEKERQGIINMAQRDADEILRKTGRKKRIGQVGGGGAVVKQLMDPIIGSLGKAVAMYRQAFEEQSKEIAEEGG